MTAITTTPASLRIHRFVGLEPGARLLLLGAVHGNETCGTVALDQLVAEFDRGDRRLARGTLTIVPIANPLAFARRERHGHRNLNRAVMRREHPRDFEERVANVLCQLFVEHDALVDLHSFSAPGEPFVLIGPEDNRGDLEPFARAREEERLAAHLGPQRVVEGWMRTYAAGVRRRSDGASAEALRDAIDFGIGTTERMRASGGYAVTVECGQHDDPRAPAVAYRAATQALALLGLLEDATPAPPATTFEVLRLCEVIDRANLGDRLARPWQSFDPVRAGERVGTFAAGNDLVAPCDGRVVFPNPDAEPGTEWIYFAEVSPRALRHDGGTGVSGHIVASTRA
jgi:predicted deacylase